MKIYFDNIIFFQQKSGGGSMYWYELISRAVKSKSKIFFIEPFKFHEENNIFRKRLKLENIILKKKLPMFLEKLISVKIDEKEKFVFHSCNYRITKNKKAINIVTVHDFTNEYYGNGLSKIINYFHKKNAIKNADGIICISENTKKDMIKFFPWVENKKIKIIYHGIDDKFNKLLNEQKKILGDKFNNSISDKKKVLFVGARNKYKNFNDVVDAIDLLGNEYYLIVVGKDLSLEEKKYLEKIKDRFILLKNIGIEKEKYNQIMNVEILSGCFMFIRTEALKKVGLFDERFFMYFEDFDLNRRIHEKYKTIFFPKVEIVHKHAKEAHKNLKMTLVGLKSAVKYFNKWGWM